ncbi:hypothetical protein RvY_15053 [Ramazzottius varieornatus]|uniref:Fibronectin type-III domain-containing protein n=1 Tax=Ramazzottius varieornatus TaxID=947166 RepID=A0A1D1VX37_RAMVA|nr:hypothetical protein RvY_15053 [Ramazzottius varieornatus]
MLDRRIAALGRPFKLGHIYDIRTDEIGLSFVRVRNASEPQALPAEVEYISPTSPIVNIIRNDSLRTKLNILNNDQVDDLMLQLALKIVKPTGSGSYLYNSRASQNQVRVVVGCIFLFKWERLTKKHFEDIDSLNALCANDIGTHVISAIGHGLDFFLVLDYSLASGRTYADAERQLVNLAETIIQMIREPQREFGQLNDIAQHVRVSVHSDLDAQTLDFTVFETMEFCRDLRATVSKRIDHAAIPKSVWLDSLSSLDPRIRRAEVTLRPKLIENAIDIMCFFDEMTMRLKDLLKHPVNFKLSLLRRAVQEMLAQNESKRTELQNAIASRLPDIQRGDVHPKLLDAIMDQHQTLEQNQPSLSEWIACRMQENDRLSAVMDLLGQYEFIAGPERLENFSDAHAGQPVVCLAINPCARNNQTLSRVYRTAKNREAMPMRGPSGRRPAPFDLRNARPTWFTWTKTSACETVERIANEYWDYATANKSVLCIVVQSSELSGDVVETFCYAEGRKSPFDLPLPVEDFQVTDATTTSISLRWKERFVVGPRADREKYMVQYRETNKSPRQTDNDWIPYGGRLISNVVKVNDLSPATAYDFSVVTVGWIGNSRAKLLRSLHTLEPFTVAGQGRSKHKENPGSFPTDSEGSAGQPKLRPVRYINLVMEGCQLLHKAKPSLYALPVTQLGCDPHKKIRKYYVGPKAPPNETAQEKVVLLMGKTGAGKTTLINGLANYMLGVKFDDPVRFKLIREEGESDPGKQTKSMTQWVSSYHIPKRADCPYPFSLTIIDTPGMGDTAGVQRDAEIQDQLKAFFGCGDLTLAIDQIDAVGLVMPSSSVRLDAGQKYILHTIMSVFGKDIMGNMFLLLTFADQKRPEALIKGVEQETGITFASTCKFNNCALYEPNANEADPFTRSYWDIGATSMETFFTRLVHTTPQSLVLSREVMEERRRIHVRLDAILKRSEEVRERMATIRANERQLDQADSEVKANSNHTVEIECEEVVRQPHPGGPGRFLTNCRVCNFTCHATCAIEKDDDKRDCSAMNRQTGFCTACPKKCEWTCHSNTPYIYVYQKKKQLKVLQEILQRFNIFSSNKQRIRAYLDDLRKQYRNLEVEQAENVRELKDAFDKLNRIAVNSDSFSMIDYYDQCIEEAKQSKRPDYEKQMEFLQKEREKEIIALKVKRGDQV